MRCPRNRIGTKTFFKVSSSWKETRIFMVQPCMLMILDGFGVREEKEDNAIKLAQMPNYNRFLESYPHTTLQASGYDVGLPKGLMGNSEVGHLNMSAGEIVWQTLSKIDRSIEEGTFAQNPCLNQMIDHALSHQRAIHLMGLTSDGGVHASDAHHRELLKLFQKKGVPRVYFHAFMDGRDTPPKSGIDHINRLDTYMKEIGCGEIVTVSGRYYPMDRDKRWERVEKGYRAIFEGEGYKAQTPQEAILKAYERGETDEFIIPTVIRSVPIQDGDAFFFFNFRADRARQLTQAILDPQFKEFARPKFCKVYFAAMVHYEKGLDYPTAFENQSVENSVGELVSKKGWPQLRIAETEKFAHVTFFFSGGREAPFLLEDRILIPSPKVATYDLKPEMSAEEVTERVLKAIAEDKYHLIVLNFANPDMVGHSGILSAAIKAVEAVDKCLGRIEKAILAKKGTLFVTSDHGNCEMMRDPITGQPHTSHTTNPVPAILIGEPYKGLKLLSGRRLSDVAPTLSKMMGLPIPKSMTAQGLIS